MASIGSNDGILNGKQVPQFYADTFANRKAQPATGTFLVATDLQAFYRFNGSSYDLWGGPGTGTVTGSGTTGKIPLWTGASVLADSALSQAAGNVTSSGNFTVAADLITSAVVRESSTGNAWFNYSAPDTRFIILNAAGSIQFRDNNNTNTLFTIQNNGDILTGIVIREASSNNAWFNYNAPDTRFVNINVTGKIALRNNANTGDLLTLDNTGNGVFTGTATATSFLGNATSASSLTGGAGGSIPYQSAPGVTAMLANGSAGQVLTSAGTTLPPIWAPSSGGSVTSVSVTTASGVSGTVATPTTTPAITITLGAITPTSVNKITITQPATGATLTIPDGTTINTGTGGTLGSNAFTSTAYAPIASPTFTGVVTMPTPFTLGAISVTSTGTQLNYLNAATGTTGTASTNLVYSASPTFTGTVTMQALAATSGNFNPGTTNHILIGQNSDSATYGAISFSGSLSNAARLGLTGGGGTDNNLYIDVPATGSFNFRVAASNVASISTTGVINSSSLSVSQAVFTDASKNLVSNAISGTGNVAMTTSAVFTTPNLGTPSALVLTNATGSGSFTAAAASNITGGSGGQLLYQSAAGTTSKLANGTVGQILQAGGTTVAPSWTTALANGITATTQSAGDNSTKLATTAYVDTGINGTSGTIPVFTGAHTIGNSNWLTASYMITPDNNNNQIIFSANTTLIGAALVLPGGGGSNADAPTLRMGNTGKTVAAMQAQTNGVGTGFLAYSSDFPSGSIKRYGTIGIDGAWYLGNDDGSTVTYADAGIKFQVLGNIKNSGSIQTGAPSGGTAGAWKLGIKIVAVSALDTTGYLQVDIGGTAYKLALIT